MSESRSVLRCGVEFMKSGVTVDEVIDAKIQEHVSEVVIHTRQL